MTISALTGRAKKITWNILPRRTTIRLCVRNILAQSRNHDRRDNLPIWTALSGLCFSMILFTVAVKHVWGELRNYESMCKQADLSAATRQRHVQLAFIESRQNPVPQNVIKHRRHRQGGIIMIKQSGLADCDDMESDATKIRPAPGSPDTDGDGLYDVEEKALGTDWRRQDTDGDGINDSVELKMGMDPASYDNISQGVSDSKIIDGNGDGSIRFGTFSYPSSGSRQKWNSPPHKAKRGRRQP